MKCHYHWCLVSEASRFPTSLRLVSALLGKEDRLEFMLEMSKGPDVSIFQKADASICTFPLMVCFETCQKKTTKNESWKRSEFFANVDIHFAWFAWSAYRGFWASPLPSRKSLAAWSQHLLWQRPPQHVLPPPFGLALFVGLQPCLYHLCQALIAFGTLLLVSTQFSVRLRMFMI